VPLLTAEHLDTPMTYEDMAAAGTMLGTGTPMLFDPTVSVVKAVTRWLEFYKHESCGKCTPCREGTYWITGLLEKFEHGAGAEAELDTIADLCGQIAGRSFCALGDAAATPYPAAMKYFREEFVTATHTPVDESFNPVASYVFAGVGAGAR
jgi:NADH-quinone oxidoreductase subunit F